MVLFFSTQNNALKAANRERVTTYPTKDQYNDKLSNGAGLYANDDPSHPARVSSKSVQVGKEKLGEGRFAVVHKGSMQRGNQTITVAVKALKSERFAHFSLYYDEMPSMEREVEQ